MNTIPAVTIEQSLRAELKAGKTAEQATEAVLRPYTEALRAAGNDSLVWYARPAVLSQAKRLHRQVVRRSEDRAFSAAPGTSDRLRLGDLEFHLPDGTKVTWADATLEQHTARILWLETYIGSLETTLRRHDRARKLLENRGASKLSDIEGWQALIGDELLEEDLDASGSGT